MINAAIVGLGWWGKTLVESAEGSDAIRFVAGATRTVSADLKAFADAHKLRLAGNFDALLADRSVDAVVLATPHSLHAQQVIAAAGARKHVFCEKPFTLTKKDAEAAVAAARKAGVTLGLGYNRRFHPEMTGLRERIRSGGLGTVMHVEATMTFPNALLLKSTQWRASRSETPCGGLTPMGVHAVDGMIDLCGRIDTVYCQSFRRAVEIDADDTTSILFRMKDGMSGYLGTLTATGPGFSFQMFGSKGWIRLEGMTHVAGASSEERRTRRFGTCKFQPAKGEAEVWQAATHDVG
ncbi:MAG TPA: Gfo/Idh/MocA family oxidoreductase, partial [Burkholderiales bacterium]